MRYKYLMKKRKYTVIDVIYLTIKMGTNHADVTTVQNIETILILLQLITILYV